MKVKENSPKGVFGIATLKENKCILRMCDRKSKSLLADLIDKQKELNKEIKNVTNLLAL